MSMNLSIIGIYDAKKDPKGLDIFKKGIFLEFFDLREKFPDCVNFGKSGHKDIIVMVIEPKIYTEKKGDITYQHLSYNANSLGRFMYLRQFDCTIMLLCTYSDLFAYKSSIVHFNEKGKPLSTDAHSKRLIESGSLINHSVPFGMPVKKIELKEGPFFNEVDYTDIRFSETLGDIYYFNSMTISRNIPKNALAGQNTELLKLTNLAIKERYEISHAS